MLCYNKTGDTMKKGIILLSLCLLAGCSSKNAKNELSATNTQLKEYRAYVQDIKNTKTFSNYSKYFSTELIMSELGNYYSYDLIIKNPKVKMYKIKAVSYSPYIKDQYHPSIGILETTTYNLVPNHFDKKNGYVKGIDLSGRVTKRSDIKVKISFTNAQKKRKVMVINVKDQNG
jgi:hypothetical protein